MALILSFVDECGFIREQFFDLAHVKDTIAFALKNEICGILSRHTLDVQNIRGQGYDGASNMHGEWKGLQALFLNNCPYAYYVHCLAHRLQLALITTSREVHYVHEFFNNLTFTINVVDASCKRHGDLQDAQAKEIARMLAIDELVFRKGANQISTLKRASDTHWGSHFNPVCNFIKMFDATCSVLENIDKDGYNYSQREDASESLKMIQSFEFIFILHLIIEIMSITDMLCQNLQQKSQDILNALHLVSSTKILIQKLREERCNGLLEDVLPLYEKHDLNTPDLNANFNEGRQRCHQSQIAIEHHYHFDIFNGVIDVQLQELKDRFNEQAVDLFRLFLALDQGKCINVSILVMFAPLQKSITFLILMTKKD